MEERRKEERLLPSEYLSVYDTANGEAIGGLANLSDGGAMFISRSQIRRGSRFHCQVALRREIREYKEVIFDVECLWSRRNIGADWWESGYKVTATATGYFRLRHVTSFTISALSILILGQHLSIIG